MGRRYAIGFPSPHERAILRVLIERNPDPGVHVDNTLFAVEIGKKTAIPRGSIYTTLARMVRKKLVWTERRGYGVTIRGRLALRAVAVLEGAT